MASHPFAPITRRARFARSALIVGMAVSATACISSGPPEVENGDPVLVEGRDIYGRRCASCHGMSGGGGRGPGLDNGRVVDNFPNEADQIALVTDGKGDMPSFGGTLTEEQIVAVVRYTRDVISG